MKSAPPKYRQFVYRDAARQSSTQGDYVGLVSPRNGRPFRLDPEEFALAQLFDGARDVAARVIAAEQLLNRPVTAAELEHFADELSQAGFLAPGEAEPLPVPPQSDAEARLVGSPSRTQDTGAMPPSTAPGSRAAPSLLGSLTPARSGAARAERELSAERWLGLGALLSAPTRSRTLALVLEVLVLGGLLALWFNRNEVRADVLMLVRHFSIFVVLAVGLLLINFCSQVSRAGAVFRETRQVPPFGVRFNIMLMPRFLTDTAGRPELEGTGARLRIIASSLSAMLVLFVLSTIAWLLTYRSGVQAVSQVAIGLAILSFSAFLVQINPLARLDGYYLLAHWLKTPDLRQRAAYALFGQARPWTEADPPLPKTALRLYGLAGFGYVVGVIALIVIYPGQWLEAAFGGTGVVIFLLLMGRLLWEQTAFMRGGAAAFGAPKLKLKAPSRRTWFVLCGLAALAIFPYTFEPGGDFTVLPRARADVRALVAGDVREVLVKEGDLVAAGDVIARLADDLPRSQLAASEAALARLKADFDLLKAGAKSEEIEVARSRVATLERRVAYSRQEAARLREAHARRAVTDQDYEKVRSTAEVDQQLLSEAQRNLDLISSAARPERIAAQEADIKAEEARRDFHKQELEHTAVRAPIAGRVVAPELKFAVGHFLNRGELLAVVEDSGELLAEVRVPETAVGEIEPGAAATAKAWGYAGTWFHGTVREIAPNAERGEYGRVVRVTVALQDPQGLLRPEMTGNAKIEGGTYPAILVYTRALARFFLVELWSWLP